MIEQIEDNRSKVLTRRLRESLTPEVMLTIASLITFVSCMNFVEIADEYNTSAIVNTVIADNEEANGNLYSSKLHHLVADADKADRNDNWFVAGLSFAGAVCLGAAAADKRYTSAQNAASA